MQLAALNRIDDGVVLGDLNAAWAQKHPDNQNLAVFSADDDGMLVWLSDRSPAAVSFATNCPWNYSNPAASIDRKAVVHSGLAQIFPGVQANLYFGTQPGNPRTPDIFGITQYGVVYTGHMHKIAEHGGAHLEDRNVALVIFAAGVHHAQSSDQWVETTQIAPTILRLLGLNPGALLAVREEGTQPLAVS